KGGYLGRVLRWLCYTRKWKFEEDWYFKLYNNDRIMIPKGFRFDGTSVPKPLRFLLSPTGILFIPGIIHDYGYRFDKLIGVKIDENDKEFLYNYHLGAGKAFWDSTFRRVGYQVCRLYIVTTIAYWAVVLFGFNAWNKCRKLELK
ncbi:MAG: DUF1353 domain-containing protein, partial [Proteobacteria bacterium]|nr:DUF1353 domain-containing protein [Pseudomonadota bacterium]